MLTYKNKNNWCTMLFNSRLGPMYSMLLFQWCFWKKMSGVCSLKLYCFTYICLLLINFLQENSSHTITNNCGIFVSVIYGIWSLSPRRRWEDSVPETAVRRPRLELPLWGTLWREWGTGYSFQKTKGNTWDWPFFFIYISLATFYWRNIFHWSSAPMCRQMDYF